MRRFDFRPHSFETTFVSDHILMRPHSLRPESFETHIHLRPHSF